MLDRSSSAMPRRSPKNSPDLTFDSKGGPLVAIAGLTGGAGVSTLTLLIGLVAAQTSSAPIIVCDAGGPTGGLAYYAGVAAPRSLPEAADLLASDQPLAGGLFAVAHDGLRVLASEPQFLSDGSPEAVEVVLADARAAHGLTVVDCGTLTRSAERQALSLATHVVWLLPATVSGAGRAQRVLSTIEPFLPGCEIVCARRDKAEKKPPLKTLTEIADERVASLVLMPHIPDLASADPDDAVEAAQVPLHAIGGLLRRANAWSGQLVEDAHIPHGEDQGPDGRPGDVDRAA
jgi:MinD-like ATPase involved in chromosome partitioning or flagellar assembly